MDRVDAIFMQDNTPIHTAYIVNDWLDEQEYEVMNLPAYSSDLNPIENLWFWLKEAIYKHHLELLDLEDTQETLAAFVTAAQDCWEDISAELYATLSNSMPHRVQAVLSAEGWYTKY